MLECDDFKKEEDDTEAVVKMEVDWDEENDSQLRGTSKIKDEDEVSEVHSPDPENDMQQCVYCNVFLHREKMRPVTKNYVALGLWCRKLGDDFRNRIETAINPFMCLSHFHDNDYVITEFARDVAVPLSMDEKKQHGLICCAYCYTMSSINSTFPVPSAINREVWIDELGQRFRENLKMMVFPSICKSHIRDYETVAIPFPDEFIMQLEMEERMKMLPVENDYWYSTCAYCCVSRRKSGMVIVPLDESTLEKWSNLLGYSFDHNILRKNKPRICKSHFNKLVTDSNGEVIDGVLPMPFRNTRSKPEKYPKSICTFCNNMNYWRNMRLVVKCYKKRRIWSRILGKDFDNNCNLDLLPTICRSHFYVFTLKNGKKYYGKTPNNWKVVENIEMKSNHDVVAETALLKDESHQECSRLCEEVSTEELSEMYQFGWNTVGQMLRNSVRLSTGEHDFYRNELRRRSATKCIFCHSYVPDSSCSHKVFPGVRVFEEYAKVFGLQYKSRLKNVELDKMEKPSLRLCKYHFDGNMKAVPDEYQNYSVDELLDHNYADFYYPYEGIY